MAMVSVWTGNRAACLVLAQERIVARGCVLCLSGKLGAFLSRGISGATSLAQDLRMLHLRLLLPEG
ncbi:MAG TPA: hypothetical protein VGZ91_00270 [Candidatus Sulfotelmatobacter sp.]|jgi:hypothetical protein|nr:hypothetical protein [Candidatus Sulfotelmatobacter sp.]